MFGALLAYPGSSGEIRDLRPVIEALHAAGAIATVASDLLALCLLEAPGNWGADIVLGSAQRFGVPMGYGGPHAAFFATKDAHQALDARPHHRRQPGRARQAGAAHGAADPRAAHPPREGDEQHLHGPGPARGHGRHVRGLARPPRPGRRSRRRVHGLTADLAGRARRRGHRPGQQLLLRHADARACPARRPPSSTPQRWPASTSGRSTPTTWRCRSTRRSPAEEIDQLASLLGAASPAEPASRPARCGACARAPTSPTRSSACTAARPRCCAICASCSSRTSPSTAR